jgi:hypothetical protein
MAGRYRAMLLVLGITAIVGLSVAKPTWAETLVESNVDTRTALALRVGEAGLTTWLPAPWQLDPTSSGPSKGANLSVIFIDRLLAQDAAGKPLGAGIDRIVAFVIPAKHPQTGESAPFVIRVFTTNPQAVPGPYKNYVHATIRREQTQQGANLEPGTGAEQWELRNAAGELLDLRLRYQRGVPVRTTVESRPHSAVDPSFFRIYRIDQGLDVVRSAPASIDRVQGYQLRVTLTEFRKLFDGSEQLVSIAVVPWHVRHVYLP